MPCSGRVAHRVMLVIFERAAWRESLCTQAAALQVKAPVRKRLKRCITKT